MPNTSEQSRREKLLAWLENIPVLTAAPTDNQQAEIESLVGNKAFELLLGTMLGERQTYLMSLSKLPLVTPENSYYAAVLQGKIDGIDRIRFLLLELLAVNANDPTEGE